MVRIPQFNVSDITFQMSFWISVKLFGFVMTLCLILFRDVRVQLLSRFQCFLLPKFMCFLFFSAQNWHFYSNFALFFCDLSHPCLLQENSIIASVFTALFARLTLLFYYHLVRSCKTLT